VSFVYVSFFLANKDVHMYVCVCIRFRRFAFSYTNCRRSCFMWFILCHSSFRRFQTMFRCSIPYK